MSQGNAELMKMLAEIDPKQPYGTALFDALARLTLSVAVEVVCLREVVDDELRGKTHHEVYLVQRAVDDTAYPGQWHCPGSVMRPGESVQDVMDRLSKREFGASLLSWDFVANFNHPCEERGHFFSLVYRCKLDEGGSPRGKWFPISGGPRELRGLPENTVKHHRTSIIPALWVPAIQ